MCWFQASSMEVMVAFRALPPRSEVLKATFSPSVRNSSNFLSPTPRAVSKSWKYQVGNDRWWSTTPWISYISKTLLKVAFWKSKFSISGYLYPWCHTPFGNSLYLDGLCQKSLQFSQFQHSLVPQSNLLLLIMFFPHSLSLSPTYLVNSPFCISSMCPNHLNVLLIYFTLSTDPHSTPTVHSLPRVAQCSFPRTPGQSDYLENNEENWSGFISLCER